MYMQPIYKHTYLEDCLPELAALDDVDEEVDGGVEREEAVGDVDDELDRPRGVAGADADGLGGAGERLVDVGDDLEALAEDEDGHDGQEDEGQVDLVLVDHGGAYVYSGIDSV